MFCFWGTIPSVMSRMTAGLDHRGEDAVPVDLLGEDFEVVQVPVQGAFLIQGEKPVL